MEKVPEDDEELTVKDEFYQIAWHGFLVSRICTEGLANALGRTRDLAKLWIYRAKYHRRAKGYLNIIEVLFTDDELDNWRGDENISN